MDDLAIQIKFETAQLKKILNELEIVADNGDADHEKEIKHLSDVHSEKLKTSSEWFEEEIENLKLLLSETKGQLKSSQAAGKKYKLELDKLAEEVSNLKKDVGYTETKLLHAEQQAIELSIINKD